MTRRRVLAALVSLAATALSYRRWRRPIRHETIVLTDVGRYVESLVYYETEPPGASMTLTQEGLVLGCDRTSGAWSLAGWLMRQDGWRGSRSQHNVSEEIWAHCVAWMKL